MSTFLRNTWVALRALLVLTVVLGVAYPVLIWGIGQTAFSSKANGSLIERDGQVVASELVGQNFTDPQWFHSRPSLAGDGYDLAATGGSNLAAGSAELVKTVKQRQEAVAQEEGVSASDVPADAVTASASGLDPDISPAYAYLQVKRVAEQNGLTENQVKALVTDHVSGGVVSPETVNIVKLNLALEDLAAKS